MTDLRTGFGKADITPPVGLDLTGFIIRENPSDSVLDPLYARALWLEHEERKLLVIGLDCLGLDNGLRIHLKRHLAWELKVPIQNISFWCSHTHSGPATVFLYGCGRMDWPYLSGRLTEGVITAARSALGKAVPARVKYAVTTLPDWHDYRRDPRPEVSDADKVDHRLAGLWFEARNGHPLGCLWTYTAHPTILCTKQITSEWPGRVAARLEEQNGQIALFGQGCAGDVSPIRDGERLEKLRAMGEGVAAALVASAEHANPLEIDSLATKSAEIDLPLQEPPDARELETVARERRAEAETLPPGPDRRIAEAGAHWAEYLLQRANPRRRKVYLQVMRLGKIRLAMLPFEPLSGVGHSIREQLGEDVYVIGYANGLHSYLAPASQYAAGGYEIEEAWRYYGLPSNYEPEAAAMVVKTVVELAEGL